MKLGIIIDSSSGLTEKEANNKGWGYLPLHIFIDKKDYKEGVDITKEEVCQIININTQTQTSVTSPGEVMIVMEKIKEQFDEIIVLPISSKLSSQFSNLTALYREEKNIHVFDTKALSIGIELMANRALRLAEENKSIKEILVDLENVRKSSKCLVVPKQLDWLVKGGRVNKKIAAMANMLKIIPIIELDDGELKKHGKGRTFDKTILKSTKEIINHFKNRKMEFWLVHSGNKDVEQYASQIKENFGIEVKIEMLPSSITMHVGLETIAMFGYKK